MTDALVVLSTVSDEKSAVTIAQTLVKDNLAACVNIIPAVRSIYSWQGVLQDDSEILTIIKTDQSRYPKLEKRLIELHPYDCPEVLALPVECGSEQYLAWLAGHAR